MADAKQQFELTIRQLVPIIGLSPQFQIQLIERAIVLELRKGKYIFRQGDTDDYSFYLLEGEVEMEADGQVRNIIKGGTDSARYPLAQLQPRQFSARARTPLKVLQVNRNALDKLLVLGQEQGARAGGIEVDEAAQVEVDVIDAQDDATDWMTRMLQSELFSRLPTANIQRLFTALEPVEFKAGDVVVQQGEPGDYYYIIQDGRCEVLRKPHPNAQDVKLAELKTGDDFGEEALLTGATRNATVRMLTEGVLMRLTKDDFIELIKNPALKAVAYDEAKPEVQKGAVWLDVRLKEEYDRGHFKDSVLLPLGMLRVKLGTLDKGRRYIVYCDTGGRSSVGAFLLTERGFDASYLRGGLVACASAELEGADQTPPVPTAKPVTPPPAPSLAKPAARPAEQAIDPDVRASAYRAELARTEIKMEMLERSKPEFAADNQKARQETEQRLREERARLEEAKRRAEEEAARKRQEDEDRIRRLKEETERKLQTEKKKLETIYSRNAKELEKLEQMKREAEEQIRREREKLEAEAAEAKRQLSEADDIKKQLQEARAALEKEAERRRQEQAEKEKRIQEMAKRKIEEERRRMAEQFQKSNEALEQAQREKAAAEAARQAAAQEAERIIAEFKDQYARLRAEEEARLKAEREKLEREAQKIRDTLEEVRKTKDEAERARRAAEAQAMKLRVKLVRAGAKRDEELIAQVKAAEAEVSQATRELEQAEEKQKKMEEAREVVVRDLAEMSEEEKAIRAQIEAELAEWLSEQELQQPDPEELKRQAEQMRRIKERADAAKRKTQEATQSLLDEISSQLGND
jgi:CRP-like cAMP-binding protein